MTNNTSDTSRVLRGTIWIAIGAIILAALVCVVWILIGDQTAIIGRAFLTVMLLAGFAGAILLEMGLADGRKAWITTLSVGGWVLCLAVGSLKIWLPDSIDGRYSGGTLRFFELLMVMIVVLVSVALLRLTWQAIGRATAPATRVIGAAGSVFLIALAVMLVLYFTLPRVLSYPDIYWRVVIALAVLATVGLVLVPLINALTNPKAEQPMVAYPRGTQFVVRPWPTFPDGRPLPQLPDGTPDFRVYPPAASQQGGVVVDRPAEGVPIAGASMQAPPSQYPGAPQ